MDAEGARALAARIAASNSATARPKTIELPPDALPVYGWVGVEPAKRSTAADPLPPARRSWTDRLRRRAA